MCKCGRRIISEVLLCTGNHAFPIQSASHSAEGDPCCFRVQVTALAAEWADELSEILLASGAEAVSLEEHRPPGSPEQEIFDDGTRRLWQSCTLVAHFPLDVRSARHQSQLAPCVSPRHVYSKAWPT